MKYNNGIRIALVILARDEAATIGITVESVINALSPGDMLFVVADNCIDNTVCSAQAAGAHVVIRDNGTPNGKGEALGWFLSQYHEDLRKFSMLVILDADSQIKPDFVTRVKANISVESKALQCFVYPVHENSTSISPLASLSELLEQRFSNKIRKFLRWPVRLRGTGMVIRPALLIEASHRLNTKVEDLALSLLLTAKGIHIEQVDEAIVYDPKPISASAASIQRARWFRGQWQAMWQYRREIARVLFRGPVGWSLLSSLFLRPKWLVLMGSLIFALIFSHWLWLSFVWAIYFMLSMTYLIIGMILIPERPSLIAVLLRAPAYVMMWIQGIVLSLRSSSWRRARE